MMGGMDGESPVAGSRVGGLASRPSKKSTKQKPGHHQNRIKITSKDKALYKDDYYLEKRVSHKEAERLYQAFCREHSHPQCFVSSWAGEVI